MVPCSKIQVSGMSRVISRALQKYQEFYILMDFKFGPNVTKILDSQPDFSAFQFCSFQSQSDSTVSVVRPFVRLSVCPFVRP